VVTRGLQRGVLLPQVPGAFAWDRREFLENLCRKAGLPRDAWKHGAELQRFEAEIVSESDPG
jgi:AMMECR1 domain-containing protein